MRDAHCVCSYSPCLPGGLKLLLCGKPDDLKSQFKTRGGDGDWGIQPGRFAQVQLHEQGGFTDRDIRCMFGPDLVLSETGTGRSSRTTWHRCVPSAGWRQGLGHPARALSTCATLSAECCHRQRHSIPKRYHLKKTGTGRLCKIVWHKRVISPVVRMSVSASVCAPVPGYAMDLERLSDWSASSAACPAAASLP